MATRGTPLPAALIALLRRLRSVLSLKAAAREAGVSRNTARKYVRGAGPPPA
jgi:molybdenum-dependent DNA-binding transcriptional regulator ModE